MRFFCLCFIFLGAHTARAQSVWDPETDPFARGRWHVEFALQAALEAWNYNSSHEELYGLIEGVTYGVRDGLVLRTVPKNSAADKPHCDEQRAR